MPKSQSKRRLTSKASGKKTAPNVSTAAEPLTALTVCRNRPYQNIDPSKLRAPEWMIGPDPIFRDLYLKYMKGYIFGYATRIPLNAIKAGFYLPSKSFEYRCDSPPDEVIRRIMLNIQQGERYPLHLYGNINENCGYDFLCSDDIAILKAYRRLHIQAVPALVLAPRGKQLPFSSFEVGTRKSEYENQARIRKIVSADKPSHVRTILGETPSEDWMTAIDTITNVVSDLIARLRLFHLPGTAKLHYHHMIFSALIRAKETLEAIKALIERNLWYQALALLRVLYELHLNFYFDWLQPEHNYRYLAAATVFNDKEVARAKEEWIEKLIGEGVEHEVAKRHAGDTWLPVLMASKVSDKARLPIVSILFHEDIYDFLSQISHQNFEVASLHANRFDDETFKTISEDVKSTYLRFIDIIVAEFATCVNDDIGEYTPSAKAA